MNASNSKITAVDPALQSPLEELTVALPAVVEALKLAPPIPVARLVGMIRRRLLTRLSPDFPLLAAICGGGSAGKSSLFNSLVGAPLSPAGGRAGMNRRALLAAHSRLFQHPEFCRELFAPFDAAPQPLTHKEALTEPGPPLYLEHDGVPPELVLLDTPDFDTGAKGVYTNRPLARQALAACDLFIYIFTNSNYNNRDNTDFIADLLTGIGLRKCFLVYRVYPSFSDQEVREHAAAVAQNIYGDQVRNGILGIYRADEDNAVAAGERLLTLRPADEGRPELKSALGRLDRHGLRAGFLEALLADVIHQAHAVQAAGLGAHANLKAYLDGVRTVQSHCVGHALRTFPMDQVMGRFAQIWMESDPAHIRFMRQTGTVLAWPVKMLSGVVRRAAGRPSARAEKAAAEEVQAQLRENLLEAITRLRGHLMEAELTVSGLPSSSGTALGHDPAPQLDPGGRNIPVPPALAPLLSALGRRSWQGSLELLLKEESALTRLSALTESELQALADQFRVRMGLREKVTQTFAALLNVLPATVAVTYILHTGDPVGAAGIKVKLSGLFGLHDLYALVALPATSGLKKADRRQLETLLAPIAQTWFDTKTTVLKDLFETHLTGELLQQGEALLERAALELDRIERALGTLQQIRPATPTTGLDNPR